jgi:hypothetical protein
MALFCSLESTSGDGCRLASRPEFAAASVNGAAWKWPYRHVWWIRSTRVKCLDDSYPGKRGVDYMDFPGLVMEA